MSTPDALRQSLWIGAALGLGMAAAAIAVVDRKGGVRSRAAVADMPGPGEYWYAEFPFEDDPRVSKDRPVLVLKVRRGHARVLKVTSQDKSQYPEWCRVDNTSWATRSHEPASWVDVSTAHKIELGDFRRHIGNEEDPVVRRRILRSHAWLWLSGGWSRA